VNAAVHGESFVAHEVLFVSCLLFLWPAGERMFVRSVQYHMKHPDVQKDEKLKIACASFVSQVSFC
jgi:predicted metal-dependent hydrolase